MIKSSGFFFLGLFCSGFLSAQVNTEKLRNFEADKGLHHTTGFGFGLLAGNSDQYRVAVNYRLDWLSTNYYSFVIVNYERGESGGSLFSDKAFVHTRVTRNITDAWIAEIFVQKEFNKLISLNDRRLLGSGLRYEIRKIDTAAISQRFVCGLGAGLMYEREHTRAPHDIQTLVRSTNYMSLAWKLDDRVSFFSTAYFQIAYKHASDFRVLNESAFAFSVMKNLSFLASFNLRYDHEPPPSVKKYDLALTNGLNIRF